MEDSEKVLEEIRRFYQKLFTSQEVNNTGYTDQIEIPQISEADRLILEQPISLAEVDIAIKNLATGKTPGIVGLPVEFYNQFWRDVKHNMHALFLKWVEDKQMNESSKLGILSLLEKPGKDQIFLDNWRPLSLLCSDYKVFAKVIANRLKLVIDTAINKDQTGFIAGRSIAQNLMDLNSILLVVEKEQAEATVVAIDYYKAYDTVEWQALYETLRAFNFGPNFIELIKICQTDIKSQIINNGFLSEDIIITRGLRQGCPLSCLCFDLIVELIALRI